MVTNLDASIFPMMRCGEGRSLRFDRVLADVPCSGDGTLKKNVGIWKTWNALEGNGLHSYVYYLKDTFWRGTLTSLYVKASVADIATRYAHA